MKTEKAAIWLQKTIFWQQLILLTLASTWIFGLFIAMAGLFKLDNEGAAVMIPYLLFVTIVAGSLAYIIQQLHHSIERTKAYWRTEPEWIWLEALQYQRHFWKFFCLFLLLVFGIGCLIAFGLLLEST
ncbi:MAG: hypothetical protein ACRBFS_12610 [Aureispira sp.]